MQRNIQIHQEEAHNWCAKEDYYVRNEKFCDKLEKGEDDTVFEDEQDNPNICSIM